ncbi:MAG: hypothetical protein L6277_10520, partial [Desulfobacterales bacterium]|nr:hypothetical protein [Pseudomonadota bacterium]MCG2772507.1 hypothetical protein [Desulfobacterales bacterium]
SPRLLSCSTPLGSGLGLGVIPPENYQPLGCHILKVHPNRNKSFFVKLITVLAYTIRGCAQ